MDEWLKIQVKTIALQRLSQWRFIFNFHLLTAILHQSSGINMKILSQWKCKFSTQVAVELLHIVYLIIDRVLQMHIVPWIQFVWIHLLQFHRFYLIMLLLVMATVMVTWWYCGDDGDGHDNTDVPHNLDFDEDNNVDRKQLWLLREIHLATKFVPTIRRSWDPLLGFPPLQHLPCASWAHDFSCSWYCSTE